MLLTLGISSQNSSNLCVFIKKKQAPEKEAELFDYLARQGLQDWELWDISSKVASACGKLLKTYCNFFSKGKRVTVKQRKFNHLEIADLWVF